MTVKHPALTQALAVVLAVLCLTMAAAGALGLRNAQREHEALLADMTRLRQRAGEYRVLADRSSGLPSFDEQREALRAREAEHDRESARHRTELGTFTATKYGINMGTEKLDEADAQFNAVYSTVARALPAVEKGLDDLSVLLDAVSQLYDAADETVWRAKVHLATARSFAAYLDSGEELTAAQAVAAYDELLAVADEAAAAKETLRELRPALDAIAAYDPSTLTAMTDEFAAFSGSLGDFGSVSLAGYTDFGVDMPYDLDRLAQLQQGFSAEWTHISALLDALEEAEALSQALGQAVGIDPNALRADARSERDALAARGDEPLSPEEAETVRAVYAANSEQIHAALDRAEAELGSAADSLYEIGLGLIEARGALKSFSDLLYVAEGGIRAAADALYQARAMIQEQIEQQKEKEAALTAEKTALDGQAAELGRLGSEAEEQRDLESRLRSARAALMNREAVRLRSEQGLEPDAAALAYAAQREGAEALALRQRNKACVLMLVGSALGLLALPAAFSGKHPRLLLAPVLLCFTCALAAEWIFRTMGRGDSYSCLAAAVFALLQLLVSLPGRKKKPQDV